MLTIFFHHIFLYDGAGHMAVSFFFVLSGFSLTLGYGDRINQNQFSYLHYLKRRFVRLYPIHWLCTIPILPFVLFSLYLDSVFLSDELPIFVLNACLLHSLIPIKEYYFSFNWVSWYLSDIVVMAVLFPFFFKLIRRIPYLANIVMLAMLVFFYTMLVRCTPAEWQHALLYVHPVTRLLDFIMGIYACIIFIKWNERHKKGTYYNKNEKLIFVILGFISFISMIIISVEVSIDNPYSIAFYYWLPTVMLIFSVSAISKMGEVNFLKNKWLIYLGDISLSFFMVHQIVIRYARTLHKMLYKTDDISSPFWIASILIFVILLSHCSNKYFEKPVAKWLAKK